MKLAFVTHTIAAIGAEHGVCVDPELRGPPKKCRKTGWIVMDTLDIQQGPTQHVANGKAVRI
ncbi:hypothetical protein AB9F29_05545 [Falsihalocynthiibacter sp. S25ZX9]|uniref:hypothetical protein n=1 Tax=Falsihalocynthiibacter sp. S25ZX9 TaxID=3240870 RepID=UPI00350EEDF6